MENERLKKRVETLTGTNQFLLEENAKMRIEHSVDRRGVGRY